MQQHSPGPRSTVKLRHATMASRSIKVSPNNAFLLFDYTPRLAAGQSRFKMLNVSLVRLPAASSKPGSVLLDRHDFQELDTAKYESSTNSILCPDAAFAVAPIDASLRPDVSQLLAQILLTLAKPLNAVISQQRGRPSKSIGDFGGRHLDLAGFPPFANSPRCFRR